MELPDCPPGAEGYQDSCIEKPKKPNLDENCTKAEQEFQDHLNSLKIKVEDGSARCMVERRGRDISGKWIYLCYPCAAMCSGESILQTHISGKKHKTKLSMRNVWPLSIFEDHPYVQSEKTGSKGGTTEKVLQKMAEEVDLHNKDSNELESLLNKYRSVRCHIQDIIENVKTPLLGLEYLIEHPPEQEHYEPSYICTLCIKHGHPRTIINHMTCYWHRYNFLARHFPKATEKLNPYRTQSNYREGMTLIINRLAARIEEKYGRMRPVNIDKEEYEKDKERIHQWIFKGKHYTEQMGATFEEVVDTDLIISLHKSNVDSQSKTANAGRGRDPSPPVVAAPTKPRERNYRSRRAGSMDGLSDISDEPHRTGRDDRNKASSSARARRAAPEPWEARETREGREAREGREGREARRRDPSPPFRSRFALKNAPGAPPPAAKDKEKKPPNYEYKVKLAEERCKQAEDSLKKTLAYHEKNPEKHPLYPDEWKKFWNRRYKEIQAEGKDPSKHDFKPEWIVFWTSRMRDLHEEELRADILEIYRKLCLSPPDMSRRLEPKKKPVEKRRSVTPRRRSAERRRSPAERRRSPDRRRDRDRDPPPDFRREHRGPEFRHHSPPRHPRSSLDRSRSPVYRGVERHRSPARTHITLESVRRSRSPLSRRGEVSRNRSPQPSHNAHGPPASMQTVLISDDELKPDDGLSPWNSDDNDMDSLPSLPDARSPLSQPRARSRTGSIVSSRASHSRPRYYGREYPAAAADLGPAENVVATLRLLVALEDFLGSLGPKIVDLLTDALKMEKERANSSEELLERESALVLIETAKEKLKGAAQAGLVPSAAAGAVRSAVVRAAATLHEADNRARKQQSNKASAASSAAAAAAAVPVAGVGSVDRAQIAQQMAAALIAQGKTDVSSEELAQLVDAVVGMAEAKKREEVKRKVEARAQSEKQARPPAPPPAAAAPSPSPAAATATAPPSAAASALQMLQSAYDEDKKIEKEDAPDAMDGLSDSDLETLLKNFNELSAEEQHSLIAYLKKLEAKEPARVERLRQYVSAAATAGPVTKEPTEKGNKEESLKPVTIESDDDDYTVEEVFHSATQKVKENQIRQEMEIVKKSLEEAKTVPAQAEPTPAKSFPTIDLTKTSATDLFALVQASLQSTSAQSAPHNAAPDVVPSATQPRSFGDLPESQPEPMQQGYSSPPRNYDSPQNFNYSPTNYNDAPQTYNDGPQNFDDGSQHFNDGQQNFNDGSQNFNDPSRNFNDPPQNFNNQGFNNQPRNFNQPNNPPQNFGNQNFNNPRQNFNNSPQNFNNPPQNFNNQGFRPNNPGNFGGNRNFQNDRFNEPGPWERDNIGPIRPSFGGNLGPGGPGPRGGFMNGNRPPMNQQFANRGAGGGARGNFGAPMRGRGRGFY